MTESSNTRDTEAPVNQATTSAVLPKLPEAILDFITVVDQHWGINGYILTEQRALVDWGYDSKQYQHYMSDPFVIAALKERGIEVSKELSKALAEPDSLEERRAKVLSPLQLVVANSLLNLTDQRSDSAKLKTCGVSTVVYQRWLRDKNFSTYLRTMSEDMLGDSQHEASLALLDKIKAGDLPSIKFYMEYTQRFTSKSEGGNEQKDVTGLLVKILEIIIDECDGPTAYRISERMKETTTVHAMAVDLQNIDIEIPKVAAMRELTPEMQELMTKTSIGDV